MTVEIQWYLFVFLPLMVLVIGILYLYLKIIFMKRVALTRAINAILKMRPFRRKVAVEGLVNAINSGGDDVSLTLQKAPPRMLDERLSDAPSYQRRYPWLEKSLEEWRYSNKAERE